MTIIPSRIFRFFIGFVSLIFANGCVSVNEYFVSKPTVDSDGIHITQNGVIKLGRATIAIRPANAILNSSGGGILFPFVHYKPDEYTFNSLYYKDGPSSSVDYFVLEIIISPANNHVVFVPRSVILRLQEGSEVIPVSYKKLSIQRGWYSVYYPKYFVELCHQQEGAKDNDSSLPVQLSGKSDICLAIKYKVTPPDPRMGFSIQINGLTLNGEKINMPIIKFVPGKYRINLA